ncbi:GH3 auxin-responsive promoter family protein [Rhizosphaericola mali]|uniref:GH3 auxin-responsive promoter family protein n=1 Tax=Rhizosphaericola mali TaxID=2545455 RepID=A0A5P2FXJ0_9BACT|nr:GH3 auxin-responsive promoter family protein [Rhizosphaericola mali]QES87657.1 GH3 auxin-responsive promoter family protein [Rhizosphaericola mali]
MNLLSSAISRLARLRYWRIESWIEHPLEAQMEVLDNLLSHGQYTVFGEKYGFNREWDTQDFKKNVPISEYEDLQPYIDLIMHGQENILWNTPVNWFAKSSGTSGGVSKFIPISEESLDKCHFQGAKDVLTMYYNEYPESQLLTGKGLVIGGSHQISQLSEEIYYGDLSAVLMQNTPFWGEWIRTPELSIALMDEWESKIEAIAHATISENVTSISGVPSWTSILLKRILELTGKKNIGEVWPNLELYMHGGVSFTPYKNNFEKLIGKKINYLDMYNASEGFFSAQAHTDDDGMLLFLQHGIYYEFLPIDQYKVPNAKTLSLDEVQLNTNYAIVISTNGGLWRYLPGDTIQFSSLYPFKIKVTGRLKAFINAFGEELIIDNTDKAIAIASQKMNVSINEYTAGPCYFSENNNGTHEWIIEFDKTPEDLEKFTQILDEELQKLNSDYQAKRYKSIALQLPIIHTVESGTFNKWMKERGKLGGQHKVPRLANHRNYLEELLHKINAINKISA